MEPQMNTDKVKNDASRPGEEYLHQDVTKDILASAFRVHNSLGCGLLEKVYGKAMSWDLMLNNKQVVEEKAFKVVYREREVGAYYGDLVVDDKVIVEVKAVEKLDNVHRAQLLNYLRISGLRVGLLLNFANPKLEYERIVV
jgi:GxxExxY protein